MQSDQKVGLALGVLLIGTVAAFFFRNETHPARKTPKLMRAAEVDREIAEKNLTPYFAPKPVGTNVSARTISPRSDEPDVRTGERRLPSWDEIQAQLDDPFAADAALDAIPAPAPDPIPNASPPAAIAEQAIIEPAVETRQPDVAAVPSAGVAQTVHEVQRGETLSSIAGKYLGSQARFHELFVANRDQLRDADDLQIGMKLRIPDDRSMLRTASRALDPVEQPAAAAMESLNPETEPPKLKFTPVKRRPLRDPASP